MKTIKNISLLILLVSFPAFGQNQVQNQNVNGQRFLKEGEVFFGSYTSFLHTIAVQDVSRTVAVQDDGGIQTVNNWKFSDVGAASIPDSSSIRSYIDSGGGQGFGVIAVTDHAIGVWSIQSTWMKDFFPNLVTPDTVEIQARFTGGEISKVRRISMRISVQYGDSLYSMLVDKTIPMDSQWVTIRWDMKHVKDFGINLVSRIYLSFQFYSNDSCLVGGDIVVRNLKGSTKGKVSNIDFSIVSAVPEPKEVPSGFALEQNYPNPFNPSTTIKFTVPERGQVNLTIFDLQGREVKTLVNEILEQGVYEERFNASNLPSGVYFYRLGIGGFSKVMKMILLK